MNRVDVTEKIITARIIRRISWAEVAQKVGLSKEWVTQLVWGKWP